MIRKWLTVLTTTVVCVSLLSSMDNNTPTVHAAVKNSHGLVLPDAEVKRLKTIGFLDAEIREMTKQEYEMNKGLKGVEATSSTVYQRVTTEYESKNWQNEKDPKIKGTKVTNLKKSTFDKEVVAEQKKRNSMERSGGVTRLSEEQVGRNGNDYKMLTTTLIRYSKTKYRVKQTLLWKTIPKTRKFDIMGVAYEGSKFIGNQTTRFGKQSYGGKAVYLYDPTPTDDVTKIKTGEYTYDEKARGWRTSKNGMALGMNLKDNHTWKGANRYYITYFNQYMYVDFKLDVPVKNYTKKSVKVYGSYTHQYKESSVAIDNVSITYGAPTITFRYKGDKKNYDQQLTTQAYISFK